MNYEIKQEEKRTVAGFHLVGPWEQTVKKGFEQLMMWVVDWPPESPDNQYHLNK